MAAIIVENVPQPSSNFNMSGTADLVEIVLLLSVTAGSPAKPIPLVGLCDMGIIQIFQP